MSDMLLDDFESFVAEHSETCSYKEIAKLYLESHPDCKIGIQPLSIMVYESISSEQDPSRAITSNLNCVSGGDVISDSKSYKIDGGEYVLMTQVGEFRISIEEADKIFYDYSKHGLGLSQSETRRRHHLTNRQWNCIKNSLGLYKDSNIYSPYTIEITDDEDIAPLIGEAMLKKSKDEVRIVENEYNNNIIKEYKKIIRQDKRDAFTTQEFLDDLFALMPKKKVVRVVKTPEEIVTGSEIVAFVADLHIGAKTEGLISTPNYDKDVIQRRLSEVAKAVNDKCASKVTLCILGDIIESFTGMNHINSWKSMEFGAFGSKVFYQAIDILDEFFSQIHNLENIKIIGGNHDRCTPDNKLDRRCTIAEMIAMYMQRFHKGEYDVAYSDLVLTHDLNDVRIIMAHGDKKIIKTDMFQASIMQFGDATKMNYVFTGHLHSRSVKLDKGNIRWYFVPSVFSGNYYSEENGWNAKPGFFIVQEINKQLAVTDYPLSI